MGDSKESKVDTDTLIQSAYKNKPLNTTYAQYLRTTTSRNEIYLDFFQSGPNLENLDENAAFHVQRVILPSDMLRIMAEGLLEMAEGWEKEHVTQLLSEKGEDK